MARSGRAENKRVVPIDRLGKQALESRARLKRAALNLLNKYGYSSLRVEDITRRAGVAKGLFYRYFKDSYHVTHELSCDLFDRILERASKVPVTLDPYDWLFQFALTAVNEFCKNPGLLACGFELHGSFPEIQKSWKRTSHVWNLTLAGFLSERAGMRRTEAQDLAFVLAAMMEGIIYQSLVRKVDDLRKLGSDSEPLAEIIAVCWYRIVFLRLPPKSRLQYVTGLLAVPVVNC